MFGLPEGPISLSSTLKPESNVPISDTPPEVYRQARSEALTGKRSRCIRPSFSIGNIKREPA
jgi:hypothetical protein